MCDCLALLALTNFLSQYLSVSGRIELTPHHFRNIAYRYAQAVPPEIISLMFVELCPCEIRWKARSSGLGSRYVPTRNCPFYPLTPSGRKVLGDHQRSGKENAPQGGPGGVGARARARARAGGAAGPRAAAARGDSSSNSGRRDHRGVGIVEYAL
ncbi:hypothetical protein BC834DRAFT_562580 [Gloeopeniophorella convolvens]|nr:hypothetical protein BC834DRAFT_562580 [Gloeopeniophorella convolvens]